MNDWPSFKAMTFLQLMEGPADQEVLDIAPTMRALTAHGERYFRMDKVRSMRDGEYGGAYLWDRYWDADQIAARAASKATQTPSALRIDAAAGGDGAPVGCLPPDPRPAAPERTQR